MKLRRQLRFRPGMTVLVIMGVLSITLAVSFAMLHNDTASMQVGVNFSRKELARQAALTGAATAMRRITEETWVGVDEILTQSIQSNVSYTVVFATGDPQLTTADADYADYPYRLTITSTGQAVDPTDSTMITEHQVVAVLELDRKAYSEAPDTWSKADGYTVYQSANSTAYVHPPVQVQGPAMLQGAVQLMTDYPGLNSVREYYLDDLFDMQQFGQGDFRPFTDTVSLGTGRTDATTSSLLSSTLGLSVTPATLDATPPATAPGGVTTYQLYPGGEAYSIPNLTSLYGGTLSEVTLEPDPVENPLGVFRTSGAIQLASNVTLRGVLLSDGYEPDVEITGDNVRLSGVDLPTIPGGPAKIQLPVAIVNDDFRVNGAANNGELNGLVLCDDDFEFVWGVDSASFAVKGKVVASKLKLFGRSNWDYSALLWLIALDSYETAYDNGDTTELFPAWLDTVSGLDPAPQLSIGPPDQTTSYHWHDWSEPLFQADPNDLGLRWNLLRWVESK